MRASKELAAVAAKRIHKLKLSAGGESLVLNFLSEFIDAAGRKLPTEAAMEADIARKREKRRESVK